MRRLMAWWRRDSLDRDLAEELQFHLDMKARETGDPASARRTLGSPLLVRDRARDAWGWRSVDEAYWDVRAALRQFRRHPGFTATAVAILALGIGVNGAVFTLTNGALFSGFPHVDPTNRIAYIVGHPQGAAGTVSYPDYEDWRARATSFQGMVGLVLSGGARTRLADDRGAPQTYDMTQLSANAFRVLGQQPILGRDFVPADEVPGAAPVIVLSYHVWERRYGRDPAIIGHSVRINSTPASWGAVDLLNGTQATVIGVMPPALAFPFHRVDLWLPLVPSPGLSMPDLHDRGSRRFWFAFGRLADGVTLQAAQAELSSIGRQLALEYPASNRGIAPSVTTFRDFFVGPSAAALYVSMWAAVAFVLVIACANLASLMMARTMSRSREMTIRMALGAGRWRVVRQLLIETVIVSTAGSAGGWFIARWSIRAYTSLASPPNAYVRWDYPIDARVLLYMLGLSLVTGVLVGLAPALRLSRTDIHSTLTDGGRGGRGRRQRQWSDLLVAGEMALTVVLLAGAGLMVRSVLAITTTDLGVDTAHVLTAPIGLPSGTYATPEAQVSLVQRLETQLRAAPGVESVTVATALPAAAIYSPSKRGFELERREPSSDQRPRPTTATVTISPEYFRTLRATVRRGRAFTGADGPSSGAVAIVNERFATLSWPGDEPVGQRVRLFSGSEPGAWLTVVGVVSNIVQEDRTGQRVDPVVYRPFQQAPAPILWMLARTRVPPEGLSAMFRREIDAIDGDLLAGPTGFAVPLPLDERLKSNYWSHTVSSTLLLIIAGLALLLACSGLYALVAQAVSQRTRELGIRSAMGASARDIITLIARQGLHPVALGLVVGLPAAMAVAPVLRSQLVNVSPSDPATFTTATAVLVVSAALGCWLPARRAVRVDPAVALRSE